MVLYASSQQICRSPPLVERIYPHRVHTGGVVSSARVDRIGQGRLRSSVRRWAGLAPCFQYHHPQDLRAPHSAFSLLRRRGTTIIPCTCPCPPSMWELLSGDMCSLCWLRDWPSSPIIDDVCASALITDSWLCVQVCSPRLFSPIYLLAMQVPNYHSVA